MFNLVCTHIIGGSMSTNQSPQDYKITICLRGDDEMDQIMDEVKSKVSEHPDGGQFDVGDESTLEFERS